MHNILTFDQNFNVNLFYKNISNIIKKSFFLYITPQLFWESDMLMKFNLQYRF